MLSVAGTIARPASASATVTVTAAAAVTARVAGDAVARHPVAHLHACVVLVLVRSPRHRHRLRNAPVLRREGQRGRFTCATSDAALTGVTVTGPCGRVSSTTVYSTPAAPSVTDKRLRPNRHAGLVVVRHRDSHGDGPRRRSLRQTTLCLARPSRVSSSASSSSTGGNRHRTRLLMAKGLPGRRQRTADLDGCRVGARGRYREAAPGRDCLRYLVGAAVPLAQGQGGRSNADCAGDEARSWNARSAP